MWACPALVSCVMTEIIHWYKYVVIELIPLSLAYYSYTLQGAHKPDLVCSYLTCTCAHAIERHMSHGYTNTLYTSSIVCAHTCMHTCKMQNVFGCISLHKCLIMFKLSCTCTCNMACVWLLYSVLILIIINNTWWQIWDCYKEQESKWQRIRSQHQRTLISTT